MVTKCSSNDICNPNGCFPVCERIFSCHIPNYNVPAAQAGLARMKLSAFQSWERAKQKMSDPVISRGEVLGLILKLATLTTVSYYTMRLLIDALDPTRKQRLAAAKQAELMLSRLGIQPDVKLNEHEMMIASQLVDPAAVQVKFEDIAGHGELIKELRQTVILPIQVGNAGLGSPELGEII